VGWIRQSESHGKVRWKCGAGVASAYPTGCLPARPPLRLGLPALPHIRHRGQMARPSLLLLTLEQHGDLLQPSRW
jgi:hypothetical protein